MIWLMIAGMCLVTFVPRAIPFILGRDLALPAWIRRWLSFFPYAALGALIFPGILTIIPGRPWIRRIRVPRYRSMCPPVYGRPGDRYMSRISCRSHLPMM